MSEKLWIPLESNPEVLTSFGHALGLAPTTTFADVLSLDLLYLTPPPHYAIVLLFPQTDKLSVTKLSTPPSTSPPPPYFCKQTIRNACGTIALLHAALHLPPHAPALTAGSFLERFRRETEGLSAEERADRLQKDEGLDAVHGEFANQGQSRVPQLGEKVDLHFVCFVEHEGRLFELDGRKDNPVDHGVCEGLLESSAKVIKDKFMALDPDEHRFTIMTLSDS